MRRAELSRHHRQHEEEVETVSALRALLAGVVDYAGLFPPTGADMPAAVHNYAAYRVRDDAWMLGRFVVPAARLDDFSGALRTLGAEAGPEWRLSALLGANVEADVDRVRMFDREHRGRARIDSLEAKVDSEDAIRRLATAAGRGVAVFAEIGADSDVEALIGATKHAGINAKIRTGGVTSDVFPSPAAVVRFIRGCLAADVRFKATAGLHHAIGGDYRLTYDAQAPSGAMFGFLNVLLATGLLSAGMTDADATRLLDERDPAAFFIAPDKIRWRDATFDEDNVRSLRDRCMASFGSCSFTEPADELRALVRLP